MSVANLDCNCQCKGDQVRTWFAKYEMCRPCNTNHRVFQFLTKWPCLDIQPSTCRAADADAATAGVTSCACSLSHGLPLPDTGGDNPGNPSTAGILAWWDKPTANDDRTTFLPNGRSAAPAVSCSGVTTKPGEKVVAAGMSTCGAMNFATEGATMLLAADVVPPTVMGGVDACSGVTPVVADECSDGEPSLSDATAVARMVFTLASRDTGAVRTGEGGENSCTTSLYCFARAQSTPVLECCTITTCHTQHATSSG